MISEDLERTIRAALDSAGIAQAEHVAASIMRAIRAEFEGESIYIDRQCSARVSERNRIIARAIADGASIRRLASRFGVTARLIRMIRAQVRQGRIAP
jgi:Mor family transcriptional regulator